MDKIKLERLRYINDLLFEVLEKTKAETEDKEELSFIEELTKEAKDYYDNFELVSIYWEKRNDKTQKRSELEGIIKKERFDHKNIGNIEVDILERTYPQHQGKAKLYFLLATKDSEKKIRIGLRELKQQTKDLPKDYPYKILVAVNNTNDSTFMKTKEFIEKNPGVNIAIYNINTPLPGFGKLQAVNYLVKKAEQDLKETREKNSDIEAYINIIDDDIVFPEGSSVINNIHQLEKDPILKAISATYTSLKETSGFHLLTSVRKKPELVKDLTFPRVYGGTLSMRFDDYPKAGIPLTGGDSDLYFSLYFIHKAMVEKGKDPYEFRIDELPVKTNPELHVEHSDTFAYPYFIYRLVRDFELRNDALQEFPEEFWEKFNDVQCKYFRKISKRADSSGPGVSRVANLINRRLRTKIKKLYAERKIESSDFKEMWIPQFEQQSSYDFCKNFFLDEKRRDSVVDDLDKYDVFSKKDIGKMKDRSVTEKYKFKMIEAKLNSCITDGSIQSLSKENSREEILRLTHIIKKCSSLRSHLSNNESVSKILERSGVELSGNVEIEEFKGYGRANFHLYAHSGEHSYFMRYQDPLGKEFFLKFSPCRAVYTFILTENLLKNLMGEDSIISSQYPSLETASRNHIGYNEINDIERILQRIIIQKDIRDETIVWADFKDKDIDVETAIKHYSGLAAKLHGNTIGFFKNLEPQHNDDDKRGYARKLLRYNQKLMRTNSQEDYKEFLLKYSWITRKFMQTISHLEDNSMAKEIDNSLKDIGGLKTIWDHSTNQSIDMMPHLGCLGHFDITPYNQFIHLDKEGKPDGSILYDFDYLSFHEPFYECGHALYSMNNYLNLKDRQALDEYTAKENARLFLDNYRTKFIEYGGEHLDNIMERSNLDKDQVMKEGLTRASRFTGFIILSILNRNKYISGKTEEEFVTPLTGLCKSLIEGSLVS